MLSATYDCTTKLKRQNKNKLFHHRSRFYAMYENEGKKTSSKFRVKRKEIKLQLQKKMFFHLISIMKWAWLNKMGWVEYSQKYLKWDNGMVKIRVVVGKN